MKNILIADAHSLARVGLVHLIQKSLGLTRVEMAEDLDGLREQLLYQKFNILVLDIDIAGSEYTRLIYEIINIQPEIKILVFTRDENKPFKIIHLIDRLSGYLEKGAELNQVADALRTIVSGDKYFKHKHFEILLNPSIEKDKSPFGQLDIYLRKLLSDREHEVARLLVSGATITDIANSLDLKWTTVCTYQNRIFKKIAIRNSRELVLLLHAVSFNDIARYDLN